MCHSSCLLSFLPPPSLSTQCPPVLSDGKAGSAEAEGSPVPQQHWGAPAEGGCMPFQIHAHIFRHSCTSSPCHHFFQLQHQCQNQRSRRPGTLVPCAQIRLGWALKSAHLGQTPSQNIGYVQLSKSLKEIKMVYNQAWACTHTFSILLSSGQCESKGAGGGGCRRKQNDGRPMLVWQILRQRSTLKLELSSDLTCRAAKDRG